MIRKGVEVLMKLSREEIERHWAAERLRAERDAVDRLATARLRAEQEGFEEGFKRGFEIGLARGELMGRIRLLQEWLQQPVTSREELAQTPESDLVQLDAALYAQLRTRKAANGTPPAGPT
jgi:flagellar biosynthesis/type III secretory pathway protein FliH